jgi:hypothetical protein
MKIKTVAACAAALFLCALTPAAGWAQRAGFQVGIAQPPTGFPNPQPSRMAGGSTFTAAPFPQIIGPGPVILSAPLVPNFATVIVSNQVLVPGQTVFPSQLVPAAPIQRAPFIGMPRADVLQQFGQPTVTVITSTGETLYFSGGVTVIIQNGRVAGQR